MTKRRVEVADSLVEQVRVAGAGRALSHKPDTYRW